MEFLKISRKPPHIIIIYRDLIRQEMKIYEDKLHLQATMEWLYRAQDITKCGGVSGGYSFINGWMAPYPETTGYIIPTFLNYGLFINDDCYIEKAIKMGDWEINIQHPSGGIRGGVGLNDYPIVFNTGQVILGWISLYKMLQLQRYLESAIRAADWLLKVQDKDGKWSQSTYGGVPHAYHTRVAWSLLELHKVTEDEKFKIAAEKQIMWALSKSKKNAWFDCMSFSSDNVPFSHTIAYTLRGLLESSFFLEENKRLEILGKVAKASEKIMVKYEIKKSDPYSMPQYFPATLDEEWKSRDKYSCLPGNSQISIIWLKLFKIYNDVRFLNAALKMIDQVKATQIFYNKNSNIHGGIAGSYPIWGKYCRFILPNWSAKFFADAIMLQQLVIKEIEKGQK